MRKYLMAAAMLFCTAPAYAAYPLFTDDTGTQGAGCWQVEFNTAFSRSSETEGGVSFKEREGEATTVFSYGVAKRMDIVVGLPYQWYQNREDQLVTADESGIGDMTVELKWRCFEEEKNGFSLALKPGISLPTGDADKGLGIGRVTGGAVLIATKESGPLTLHANAGYHRNAYDRDEDDAASNKDIWSASVAGEYALSEKLRAVADIGIETAEEKGAQTHPSFIVGGLIYSVTENFDFDLGIKGGLNDAEPDTTMLLGVAARFN
ncbi:MAG: transporter [Chlorobiaceae bacterium]|nr:transporter [Chlorobiaceae bacterium]